MADIIAKINLPEQVSYKNANITYTKKDGSTQTENIDELAGMINEITHTLAQSCIKIILFLPTSNLKVQDI